MFATYRSVDIFLPRYNIITYMGKESRENLLYPDVKESLRKPLEKYSLFIVSNIKELLEL